MIGTGHMCGKLIKARILRHIARRHNDCDIAGMAEAERYKPVPDVPLHQRGFGVIAQGRVMSDRHRLMISVICGLLVVAVAEPTLGATDTFDGVYAGKQVLTKGSGPACPTGDDVSVTLHGEALTFTNSKLRNFSIGFDPHQDGSFRQIYTDIGGASVLIQGRVVGNVLDADVTDGPCEHHWHLTRGPAK
jgi:hypothetical protein